MPNQPNNETRVESGGIIMSTTTQELDHLKDIRAVIRWAYNHGQLKGEFPDKAIDKIVVLDAAENKANSLIESAIQEARKYELENVYCGEGEVRWTDGKEDVWLSDRIASLTNSDTIKAMEEKQ